MNKQPEALRLADALNELDAQFSFPGMCGEAASELLRLHAENQALNNALQYSMGCHREMGELAVRQRVRLDEMESQGEQELIFWYRPMVDGLYEGPLHKSQIERVRKESGGWVPLYTK